MYCEQCQAGGHDAGPERHRLIIHENKEGRWEIMSDLTSISGHNHDVKHIRSHQEWSVGDIGLQCTAILSNLGAFNDAPGIAVIAISYLHHLRQLMGMEGNVGGGGGGDGGDGEGDGGDGDGDGDGDEDEDGDGNGDGGGDDDVIEDRE
jgi:hypothetical protein